MKYLLASLVLVGFMVAGQVVKHNSFGYQVVRMQADCQGQTMLQPLRAKCSADIQKLQSGKYGNVEVLANTNGSSYWAETKGE